MFFVVHMGAATASPRYASSKKCYQNLRKPFRLPVVHSKEPILIYPNGSGKNKIRIKRQTSFTQLQDEY